MDFRIQACCPRYSGEFDKEDECLSDAIQTIFPFWAEQAVMLWKTIPIILEYKYDISIMMDDILDILKKLRSTNNGDMTINWASDTFANIWVLNWTDDTLEIKSKWGSVNGHTEQLLNSSGDIIMSKNDFAREWKRVLFIVIEGLKRSGYTDAILPRMALLISEYEEIDREGIYYTLE